MPKLDHRLQAVARMIRSEVHADIGADHGHLLAALLASGRIQRGIAIENKIAPMKNARQTLDRFGGEVRLADGLDGLKVGEANSLSICGMGGVCMVAILSRWQADWPPHLVLQPNKDAGKLRLWARRHGYGIENETFVPRRVHGRYFDVISLQKMHSASDGGFCGVDLAYLDIDPALATYYGPLNLRRRSPMLRQRLAHDLQFLQAMPNRSEDDQCRLIAIENWFISRRPGPSRLTDLG